VAAGVDVAALVALVVALRCAGHCSTPGGKFDKIVQRQGLGWINFPIRPVKCRGPAGSPGLLKFLC
jgi:hypothetical protein